MLGKLEKVELCQIRKLGVKAILLDW